MANNEQMVNTNSNTNTNNTVSTDTVDAKMLNGDIQEIPVITDEPMEEEGLSLISFFIMAILLLFINFIR